MFEESNIVESSDLAEVLKQLNLDSIDAKTGMTDIDMRSRLGAVEIPAILTLDSLVSMRVLPAQCLQLTRQKKRLAVSLYGQGRREIVKIATAQVENENEQRAIKKNSVLGLLRKKDKTGSV